MNDKRVHHQGRPRAREHGYSMIELSVALVVALFLLNGMFMIMQNTRKTSSNQTALAQLQDEERVAMTMITDVIQQAGYYPNPQTTDPTIMFTTDTTFGTAGQTIAGATNGNGDTITVRYQGDSSNSVIDCLGNTIPNNTMEEMQFSVQAGTNNNGALELVCTINGNTVPLVPNVHSLSIWYGIDANASGSTNTYLQQASMGTYWTDVHSVKITVTFVNPLYGQPGQTNAATNQYISFTRVIGVMAQTGVNSLTLF